MDPEHKKHLQSLWLKLLDSITDYKGIIGGLYAENILTSAMKERVEQKQGSDQLREILDILPKRGNRAFDVFYQVLVDRGEDDAADLLCPEKAAQRLAKAGIKTSVQQPSLLQEDDEELPTKWPDHDNHDPFRVQVTQVQDEAMKARFQKAVAGSGSTYAMHKPTRGIFLLIGNEKFKDARANGEDLADRDGTGKDTIGLTTLFEKLHFRVVSKVNLTAQEMLKAVQAQANQVDPTDNCFVCAILTHGERGMVYGTDGKTVDLETLKAAIADNCSSLIGKPKIFFIQACQGKLKDGGEPASGGQGDMAAKDTGDPETENLAASLAGVTLRGTDQFDAASERVSPKSDIYVALATVPDFVSWRNTNWGTWFVQAIVYIFARFAHKYEINQLMTRVNRLVSRAQTSKGYKQVSIYNSSLTGDFFFFPGLQHSLTQSHSEIDVGKGDDVSLRKAPPLQTASVESGPAGMGGTQGTTERGSITAQPTDGVDGGKSALV